MIALDAHGADGGVDVVFDGAALSGIAVTIFGVITAAFILMLRSTKDTSTLLNESHDAQLIATTLPADMQSVSTAAGSIDSGNPATPTSCAGASPGNNIVRLSWADEKRICGPSSMIQVQMSKTQGATRLIAPRVRQERYLASLIRV